MAAREPVSSPPGSMVFLRGRTVARHAIPVAQNGCGRRIRGKTGGNSRSTPSGFAVSIPVPVYSPVHVGVNFSIHCPVIAPANAPAIVAVYAGSSSERNGEGSFPQHLS